MKNRTFILRLLLICLVSFCALQGCGNNKESAQTSESSDDDEDEEDEEESASKKKSKKDRKKKDETKKEKKDSDRKKNKDEKEPGQKEEKPLEKVSVSVEEFENSEYEIDPDSSPFVLWEYTGYVDEATDYTWYREFIDRDYDEDGKKDRLFREVNIDEQRAYYTLDFGNGRELHVPEAYDTGFPHVEAADINEDGEKEILFTLSYDTSTHPPAVSDIWLFKYDKKSGEYVEEELPLGKGTNGARYLTFEYAQPKDNVVGFRVTETGYEGEETLDDDFIRDMVYDTEKKNIWYSKFKEKDGRTVIHCEVEPFFRKWEFLVFDIVYEDGEYVIKNMIY